MFRVHTPIIRSIRRWVAASGFPHHTEFLDRWWSWEPLRRLCVRCEWCRAPSAPCTRPTQRLSRPPPIQKLGAENRMLQLNVWCSWWWAYVPETRWAKNTLIKLPCCIKLAFQIISDKGRLQWKVYHFALTVSLYLGKYSTHGERCDCNVIMKIHFSPRIRSIIKSDALLFIVTHLQ